MTGTGTLDSNGKASRAVDTAMTVAPLQGQRRRDDLAVDVVVLHDKDSLSRRASGQAAAWSSSSSTRRAILHPQSQDIQMIGPRCRCPGRRRGGGR
jgi:hypothetical protein